MNHPNSRQVEPIAVAFAGVAYSLKVKKQGKKQILKGLTGFVPGGSLLMILGSSGAGKSTTFPLTRSLSAHQMFSGSLLDVLAGRRKSGQVTGSILFNGAPRSADFYQVRISLLLLP
jgi:ABC-type multidrug transport system ATPase subunit